MATEPIEKKVTSRDIPCGSTYFQLWQGEDVDFTILSHYYDQKCPVTPLLQNPQTKQFTISLEPSKHFILPRASYITFETRIVSVDGNEHKKLPPVSPPPKKQTSFVSQHEKTSCENTPLHSANDSLLPNGIVQSEVRSNSPLIQRHFSHGTKFVLDQGQGQKQGQGQGQTQDKQGQGQGHGQGQEGCDVRQGTSQGFVNENIEQMRLSAQEIEKRKQQEKIKMKRMEKWIKQQDEHQRRQNMREQRDEDDERQQRQRKRCSNEDFMSKRHRQMSKSVPTKVRKLSSGSTTSESDTFERRRSEKKRKESLFKKTTPPPSNDTFLGVNFDNAVIEFVFCFMHALVRDSEQGFRLLWTLCYGCLIIER